MSFDHTNDATYGDQSDSAKLEQFTGRVGVLYAFDNGLSPYASYSESFNPNATAAYNANGSGGFDITLLEPTEGEQYEVGLKYQPLGTDDLYTISYFDLKQSNLANKDSNENFYRAVGELTSKGVEVEARLRPIEQVNLIASYTYMDVEYPRTSPALLASTTAATRRMRWRATWLRCGPTTPSIRAAGRSSGGRWGALLRQELGGRREHPAHPVLHLV